MNDTDKKLQHMREQLADLRAERAVIQKKLMTLLEPVRTVQNELKEAEVRVERQLRLIWILEDQEAGANSGADNDN